MSMLAEMTPDDAVVLEERSPLQKAVLLKAAVQEYEDQIAVIRKELDREFEERTADIRDLMEKTQNQYRRVIQTSVDAGVFEEGRYSIVDKSRVTRVVRVKDFAQAFPEIFLQIASVPVTKAEALVGKIQLAALCDATQGPPQWEITIKRRGA